MLTLLERLHHHARTRGTQIAYREFSPEGARHRSLTFAELAEWTETLAVRLRRNVRPGSIVAICLANRFELVTGMLATLSAGCKALLVSPQMTESELLAAARQSNATACLAEDATSRTLESIGAAPIPFEFGSDSAVRLTASSNNGEIEPESEFSPGLMLLSSGSTGDPKIVYRDGASLDAVAANMVESIGLEANDRVLILLPLCHSYGIEHGLLAPIWAGCTVHLCNRLDTTLILEQLHGQGVTVFPGVPSMFELIAAGAAAQSLGSLRLAYSAGAPLPSSVFHDYVDRFGIRLGQLYGSSEVGSITFNHPSDPDYDPASVGSPMRGVEIRIVSSGDPSVRALPAGQEGEVAVRAPSMLRGYVGESASPLRDGFFMTGDLGRLEAAGGPCPSKSGFDGRLKLTGRSRLLIDVGALKVNPLEVEAVLGRHPLIREAAVVPIRVTETVCRLKAIVVPRNSGHIPPLDELRLFVRGHLSAHKTPRVFEVRDRLPKTSTGKVKRWELESREADGKNVQVSSCSEDTA